MELGEEREEREGKKERRTEPNGDDKKTIEFSRLPCTFFYSI